MSHFVVLEFKVSTYEFGGGHNSGHNTNETIEVAS